MSLLCSRSPTTTFASPSTMVWKGSSTSVICSVHRCVPTTSRRVVLRTGEGESELGTVSWPNDTDFDSDVLYTKVTGRPISEYIIAKK